MVLLLPLCLALLWAVVHDHRERSGLGRLSARGSFVVAYALLNGLVLALTELASIGHHLTTTTVAIVWVAVTLGLLALTRSRLEIGRRWRVVQSGWSTANVGERVAVALVGAYVALLAATGALYRPATGDSLMYHLARVERWIQNASVAPFATHFLPQIDMSPLHEYSLTQLHLLAGTDRLDGFVQLLSYVVGVVAGSEVARLLGGSRFVQVVASLLALTLPTAVLEATGTQNDLFGAAIGLCLLVVVLSWEARGPIVPRTALLGLCVALAILAKGHVIPTIGPAAAGLAVLAARGEVRTNGGAGWRRLAVATGGVLLVAGLAAGPFLARNVMVFGSPTGSDQQGLKVVDITARSAGANTVRSVATNFRIGNGTSGVEYLTSKVAFGVGARAFDLFEIDPADPRYVLGYDVDAFERRDYTAFQREAEFSADPWHVLLLTASGAVLLVSFARKRIDARPAVMALGLAIGFVALASLMRWQVFGVRFQLPGLLAWCPLIALALGRLRHQVAHVVVALLVVASVPMLVQNTERPLVGATFDDAPTYMDHYVKSNAWTANTAADYDAVAGMLASSDCEALGLANWTRFEYPIWVGLQHYGWDGEIAAVDVENESAELLDDGFTPCATLRSVPLGEPLPDGPADQHRFGELVLAFEPG